MREDWWTVVVHHRWLRRILHVSCRTRYQNTIVRETTGQEELGCMHQQKKKAYVAETCG